MPGTYFVPVNQLGSRISDSSEASSASPVHLSPMSLATSGTECVFTSAGEHVPGT